MQTNKNIQANKKKFKQKKNVLQTKRCGTCEVEEIFFFVLEKKIKFFLFLLFYGESNLNKVF
jgi:hypothetical protein